MGPLPKPQLDEVSQLRLRVRLLKEMATNINSGLSVKELVDRTLLEAHKSLSDLRISYCTLAEGLVRVVSSVAPLHMASIEGMQFPLEEGRPWAALLRQSEVLAITDAETDERIYFLRDTLRERQARALLLHPVSRSGGELAVLVFASSQVREWGSYEKEILADIAEHLSIAIREAEMLRQGEQLDRQLQNAQRMEAVGRLVGGVAHDFNNLLTGMMIYTGLLSSALGPESPLQRHVREIQGAGERGATLVGQLLSLSRKHVLETRLLSLNDVLSGMREMVQRMVGEEVLVECHLAGDLPQTRIDENQLRQAVLNLAVNARDAMPQGGRFVLTTERVAVSQSLVEQVPGLLPGDYARVRVADTGVGMSPQTVAHCFEPFFTTKPAGQGTGLGLAAVYGMVQQHGGGISVRSAPGQGTTFDLYFPVAVGELQHTDPAAHPRSRGTIFLVEDEAILRVPLTERLEAEGYRVLSAATPEGALEASRRFADVIDLLVTDLAMPGMCGEELADKLTERRPEMRVLFMSGYTDDPRARRLIAAGADFLRKPFTTEVFVTRVARMMGAETLRLAGARPVEKNNFQFGKRDLK